MKTVAAAWFGVLGIGCGIVGYGAQSLGGWAFAVEAMSYVALWYVIASVVIYAAMFLVVWASRGKKMDR